MARRRKNVYDCFANVITSDWNKLIDHPHVIVDFFESVQRIETKAPPHQNLRLNL